MLRGDVGVGVFGRHMDHWNMKDWNIKTDLFCLMISLSALQALGRLLCRNSKWIHAF